MNSESIYNLIPEEPEEIIKPPMYRSKHNPSSSNLTGSTFGSFGSTRLPGAGKMIVREAGFSFSEKWVHLVTLFLSHQTHSYLREIFLQQYSHQLPQEGGRGCV